MIVYVMTSTHEQHNHRQNKEHTSTLLVINTMNFHQTPRVETGFTQGVIYKGRSLETSTQGRNRI